ncbi:methionine sulfoxide reductase A [Ventosimonas gracilis]|uniref:Peptide methionine sulfoxide reductase MsrA n=1 Tax=Ventosimonas gracilis TaxID=1680762 RepID=A0A139SV71_9GAMM|nr:peptide-methionine (S)-S-oxide reductase MsrA [Ventosimonas gracilis]KXU38350.1 methionine sulfoxide reductase A [Ventosimonas gracilis]
MKTKIPSFFAVVAATALFVGLSGALPAGAQEGIAIPAPKLDQTDASGLQVAVLAAGCFWGVQGVFQHVEGVENAVSGYAGGDAKTANYRAVVSGRTGHAEAVQVTYDPKVISYGEILQIYFSVAHDPTQLNRQGPDRGTQYRSAIFPQNIEQAQIASAYIDQLNAAKTYRAAIVTTIEVDKPFYVAEDYHQDYMTKHPTQPYIVINDLPKVDNLKQLFPERFRNIPRLVAHNET